jgi:hypothetical protein
MRSCCRLPVGREARLGVGALLYVRHRPERALLYQIVDEYYPAFNEHLAAQGTALPWYVEQEFEDSRETVHYLCRWARSHTMVRVVTGRWKR